MAPDQAALRGSLFEVLVHLRIEEGGVFAVEELHADASPTAAGYLTIQRSDKKGTISRPDDLASSPRGTYIKPTVRIFPVTDGILIPGGGAPVCLFQSTVGSRHGISVSGAKKLLAAIRLNESAATETFHLYFVVPDLSDLPDLIPRQQMWTSATGTQYRGTDLGTLQPHFKQFRLKLPVISK